ncbi:DedA family protein [Nocardiopsis sp. NPDC006938]|uniref:DedA family protein n=1 Tax=Nocardiopsis sp. NPDC006938 TaxID=3364337 RepID=UPI0036A86823
MTTTRDTPREHGPQDTAPSPRPTREEALQRAGRAWDEEESRRAKEQWRNQRPWPSTMKRQDKVLAWMLVGIPAFFLLTMPLRPLFIADHALPLAFVTGSHAAVGAAAAFASIGEAPLWLVIVAGVVGKIKIDWLFWWVGRRWGQGMITFLVPSERGRHFAERLQTMNPWVMRMLIPLSYLPGVPGGIPHIVAGVNGMRLSTYMLLDALGALLVTAVVAGIGYGSGQAGVDVVLLIDGYAVWLMFALIFAMAAVPAISGIRDMSVRRARVLKEVGAAYDAETERLAARENDESDSAVRTPSAPAATSEDS